MRKCFVLSLLTFLLGVSSIFADEFKIKSPKNKLELTVELTNKILYSIKKDNTTILSPSEISLTLSNNIILGSLPKLLRTDEKNVDQTLEPVVKQKYKTIRDNYKELYLYFEGDYTLIFRIYDDGVAYRFQTSFPADIIIKHEKVEYNFDKDYEILFPEEKSFMSHSERMYLPIRLSEVTSERFCSLPALVKLDYGYKVVITEADLEDYCGLYLTGNQEKTYSFIGLMPQYPSRDSARNHHNIYVVERENFIAKTKGTRNFPWRVIVVSEKDGELIESTMIYKLAKPSDPNTDYSWVKPGKVAWDWWNFNNIYGVDFRAGINTQTYKYYIDFASTYGLEYLILDEGWSEPYNHLVLNPEVDVEEIIKYGKEKNVEIILWVLWKTLDNQMEEALDQFVKWGAVGIKVDFMQRDDQPIVNYYYKVANEAAKRKLLVNFHGAYKPTGLYRTYPNVITNEGVKALEHSKFNDNATPWMAVTIPFIRMLAGPMDYTPGAMHNATKDDFRPIFATPMSQGTRCHQLAMFVVFESPQQMLADSPTNYYKEAECMEFLSQVPVVWDDTKVLDAEISEFVLIARRNGSNWYLGAMTNWTARDLTIDFSFLSEGQYKIDIWQDGINADRNAVDYKKISQTVNKITKLNVHLAPGGGWVAIVSK